jgi:hypothetical protein
MTTRILTGTYSSGYTLSASYTALSIAASGVVHGVTATNFGYGGGVGVLVSFVAPVTNSGQVFGGGGAGGYPGSSKIAPGPGGSGGMGADLTAGGYLYNQNTIAGGAGGQGGGAPHGASGGGGGDGVHLGAAGTVNNSASIGGGQGGVGGLGTTGGAGGGGGVGLSTAGVAAVFNSGTVTGGTGGVGGSSNASGAGNGGTGGMGGAGVVLAAGGSIVNSGSIRGGQGGAAGAGINGGSNGTVGTGGDGVVLVAAGTLSNTGHIEGYDDGVRLETGGKVANGAATATYAQINGLDGVYSGAGGAATVTNFGSLSGSLVGVQLEGGGRVVNGSTSVTTAYIGGGLFGLGGAVLFGAGGVATLTNFGTIHGLVAFNSSKDRLIAEAGSLFTRCDGGAGTLELAGGAETITGMGMGVLGTVTGGIYMSSQDFATYLVDAAASLELTGVNELHAGASLIGDGAVGLATGATLTVDNSGKVEIGGLLSNGGTITLASTGSATEMLILAGGANFTGGGTVTLSGARARILGVSSTAEFDIAEGTVAGIGSIGLGKMTLFVDAAGVIDANATGALRIDTKDQVIQNLGLIECTAAGARLVFDPGMVQQQSGVGTILASAGVIDLEDVDVASGAVGSTGAGLVYVNVAGGEFDGSGAPITLFGQIRVSNGSNLILDGAIHNTGKLNTFGGSSTSELIIGPAGATLSGGGSVNLNNSANNHILGQAAADTLTNVDNRITGAGQLGEGIMTLVNDVGGVILGNQTTALVIDTGSIAITNAGLIENTGKGGTLIDSRVKNTGTLEAGGAGTLTLARAVSGTGVGRINGGTLYAKNTFVENVTFIGTTGVLELGHSTAYTGRVKGLSTGGTNSLDLTDIAFTSGVTQASFSGTSTSGTLTVTDGTHTAHIKLIGDYLGSTFTASSDGHGGTTVVDPSATALTHAMAGFRTGPPAGMAGIAVRLASLPPSMLVHGEVP